MGAAVVSFCSEGFSPLRYSSFPLSPETNRCSVMWLSLLNLSVVIHLFVSLAFGYQLCKLCLINVPVILLLP